jgi:hypothetical protein
MGRVVYRLNRSVFSRNQYRQEKLSRQASTLIRIDPLLIIRIDPPQTRKEIGQVMISSPGQPV